MPITLDGTLGITTPALTVSGATVLTGGISTAGNLTFTSTGNRITGDFNASPISNRPLFQSSVTNNNTTVGAMPNGTGTVAAWNTYNSSDPTNSAIGNLRISSTDVRIESTISGTGTYLPIAFYTGGSERMRIDTSGNVGIGTAGATFKLQVNGDSSFASAAFAGAVTPVTASNERITISNSYDTTLVGRFYSATAVNQKSINVGWNVNTYGSGYSGYMINGANGVLGDPYGQTIITSSTANPIIFGILSTNGFTSASATLTELMRLDSSGNLGIGTISPGYPLQITKQTSTTKLLINGDDGAGNSSGLCVTYGTAGPANPRAVLNMAGYAGQVQLYNSTNTQTVQVAGNGSSYLNGGNVGIGTATPTTQLQVVGSINSANTFGFKNRIINGQMAVWQRATSGSASGEIYFGPDRWRDGGQSYTFSQSTDVPTNSPARYSLEINSGSGSYGTFGQRIESYNCQDMAGQTVTLSFWAKLISGGGGLNINISYPNAQDNYSATTAAAASTPTATGSWAQYSVTFVATSSIVNGIQVNLYTNAQAAQIRYTLFQFEISPAPTSFDVRSIGTELALCQRYYYAMGTMTNYPAFHYSSSAYTNVILPVTMRTTPSLTSTGQGTTYYEASTSYTFAVLNWQGISPQSVSLQGSSSGGTAGYCGTFYPVFQASAEL